MTTALFSPTALQILRSSLSVDMSRLATIILGGGQGSRLYPLTLTRCKPAITFGGMYKLIDAALSNAIHSACDKIFIITQFLSSSLHKHICTTYQGNHVFSRGFIDILTAEQKPSNHHSWFQGTADAVRQNLYYLNEAPVDYFLILSGDQLYKMNFQKLLAFAQRTDAEAVIATLPVNSDDAKRMGLLMTDSDSQVVNFVEKPQHEEILNTFKIHPENRNRLGLAPQDPRLYLGSMGIYLFKREALIALLQEDLREDFGKHLLPTRIQQGKTFAYLHDGYWEDVGTIRSFYDANMGLTATHPPFNCYDEYYPLIKSPSKLPGAKIGNTRITNSIICEGSLIEGDMISHSIIGPRSIIHPGCTIKNSYIMGNDFYEPPARVARFPEQLQIGRGCVLHNVIIDKDVYLGQEVQLVNNDNLDHYDGEQVFIRDKIIVVARGASLPDGFTL